MIDVHILTLPDECSILLKECMQSLRHDPIVLHVVPGVEGHLGKGRSKALRKGTNEWVGWVDPDDVAIPGSYEKMLAVASDTSFVWMNELVWDVNPQNMYTPTCQSVRTIPHHMHIIHRDVIDYTEIEEVTSNFYHPLHKLSLQGKHINEIGYIWRRYVTSSCKKRGMDINRVKAKPLT